MTCPCPGALTFFEHVFRRVALNYFVLVVPEWHQLSSQEAWALVKSRQMPVLLWRGGATANYTAVEAAASDWRQQTKLTKLKIADVLRHCQHTFAVVVVVVAVPALFFLSECTCQCLTQLAG